MDAKQSPLALLALTCNSIGKDVVSKPSPPLQQSADKKDSQKDSKESVKSAQKVKVESSRPESMDRDSGHGNKNASLKLAAKSASPAKSSRDSHTTSRTNQNTSLRDRSRSPLDRRSSSPVDASRSSSSANQKRTASGSDQSDHVAKVAKLTDDHSRKNSSASPSYPTRPKSPRAPSPFNSAVAAAAALAGGLRPEHSLLGGLPPFPYYPFGGQQLALDAALYAASLQSTGRFSPSKLPLAPGHSALSGAVSYATVKTASGSSTLVPVCKEPYCTQCQVAIRAAQLMPAHSSASCPPGCVQCAEHILALAATSASPHHSSSAAFPSSMFHGHAFSPLGAHGSSAGATQPFVCSWVVGGGYCGKKFASSDDLLAHLRTHTAPSSAAEAAALHHSSVTPPSLSLPPGFPALPLGLMSSYAQLQSAYSALAQDSLRQSAAAAAAASYPRSLSPASLFAASRFSPYKLPSLLPPPTGAASLGSSSSLPPSLSSLYAPYLSLYGQRLGAMP